MDTQLIRVSPTIPSLELDLIADLACPWSFMGKRSLERALENLYGAPVRDLRWHGFPLHGMPETLTWREHLATRLPKGIDVDFAHQSLVDTGRELGITFAFDRLRRMPDTREAHRLVKLSAREGRQSDVVEALFNAFFEQARDIGDVRVLTDVADDLGLEPAIRAAFRNPLEGHDEIAAEEKRLRGLGVTMVPNLLINGSILVPGPADVPTYVQALDQALFPELPTDSDKRLLH